MLLFTFIHEDEKFDKNKKKSIDIDEKLFERIGNDDIEALDQLYLLTEKTMYSFTLSITRDHEEALDLMQDVYIKISSAAHLYKPMGKPLAWMFTIAKNMFYTKKKRDGRSVNMDTHIISDDMRFSYVTDLEDKIVLGGVLDILSEEERQIVILYAVSGMKHKEIAENLGLKLSTTLSKYHRALKKLKNYLEEKGIKE